MYGVLHQPDEDVDGQKGHGVSSPWRDIGTIGGEKEGLGGAFEGGARAAVAVGGLGWLGR